MRYRRGWQGLVLPALLALVCLPFSQLLFAEPDQPSDLMEEPRPFTERWLHRHARELAAQDYLPDTMDGENPLASLSYDEYRRIRFEPESAIWAEDSLPFQLQLFHPGFLHTNPVGIHLVNDGMARRLAFATELFNYQDSPVSASQLEAGGYAGFRVHHPINSADRHEEFLVFLGASYFRAVGKNQFYGLSARGLAVNTVGEGDEEFPRFTDFWIEQPSTDSGEVIIHALLDSPSVTGAFRFTAVPGDATTMDVDSRLYPRRDRPRVGIAPLTSMFLFDATNRTFVDDFRNAVHDSDGLYIAQANGENLWRPLANPPRVEVSSFGTTATAPKTFGLLQRHQSFEQFNDNEARYDKRPSLWIEPLGNWGAGHVELLEIPTDVEYHDNIVAYWQPADGLEAGQEYRYQYRMHWGNQTPAGEMAGQVIETASGSTPGSDERTFAIDYSHGQQLIDLIPDPNDVWIQATTSAGRITSVSGTLVEETGHYRTYLKLDPEETKLAELRVTLNVDGEQWGETWLYRWTR